MVSLYNKHGAFIGATSLTAFIPSVSLGSRSRSLRVKGHFEVKSQHFLVTSGKVIRRSFNTSTMSVYM